MTAMAFGRIATVVLLSLCTTSVEGQSGPRLRTDTTLFVRKDAAPLRILTSVGGGLVGGIAGAYAGYNVLPHTPNGDDPGLIELVQGFVAGVAVGAALGASAPQLQSVCSFGKRFGRSLLGAGVTATALYVASGGVRGDGAVVLLVPVGSVGGSLAALGRCWKSR